MQNALGKGRPRRAVACPDIEIAFLECACTFTRLARLRTVAWTTSLPANCCACHTQFPDRIIHNLAYCLILYELIPISRFSGRYAKMIRSRFEPTPPRRRQAIARAENILDALDRLLLTHSSEAVGLSAIAHEAGIPVSSIYHLFPTTEAAYAGLVRRYNARMDLELDALLSGALPAVWQEIARTLFAAARSFYAAHPALARLVLRPTPFGAARASDDVHIDELAARIAVEIGRRFHIPYVHALEKRLAIAIAINDRVWSLGLNDDGTISDFLFDESMRAVLGYLGNFLPPCLEPKLAPRE